MKEHATPLPLRSDTSNGLKGDVTVPGDKSISHRALMFASQMLGTTRITGLLEGNDVLDTAKALQALGVSVVRVAKQTWEVHGVGVGGLKESEAVLDMGNSGTSTRLLMGLVTPYPFTTFFTGDSSLRSRPMGRVTTPLSLIGAAFQARTGGRLPLALVGAAHATPINYKLPVASAQVKSAILLAGLNTQGTTTVIEPHPTRDHTENMLKSLGFDISVETGADGTKTITLEGKQPQTTADREIDVPADPSSAAFLVVAALICKHSSIYLRNVCVNPLRTGLFTTLQEMGGKIELKNERIVAGEKVADIVVESSALKGVTVPAERAPSMIDEYPILAVAASFATGQTVMHGLGELRVKESDRLSAIMNALLECGVEAIVNGDTLTVEGCGPELPRGAAEIRTHYDHRIAMAFLVMGMASQQPISVDDASAIATSFPDFVQLFNRIGASIIAPSNAPAPAAMQKPIVIAVDGPAASGKGTVARRLAEYFRLDYLDTGSLYRAVGMKMVYAGHNPSDREAALKAALTIDTEDLSNPRLRQEHIGHAASIISSYPEVRQALLDFQRNFAASPRGAVLDGRDIGTVICPDADFKFFITATLFARAKRRHKELQGQGIEVVFESVLEDLRERDQRDEKRSIAPLKAASDAFIIDTSAMDASAVFDKACQLILQKRTSEVA